ncbi:MAG: 3-hydroxyacyl-CoA dehydrogenase [Proteobacteria bacterium]|nr:3-hydroxyacyl-CoA dehydrogenase [Pseudomonadota bacterium]
MIDSISSVAVIGAGTMGIGIAEVAASHDQQVLLFDVNLAQAEISYRTMADRLAKRVARGKLSEQDRSQLLASIKIVSELVELESVDLVIEAIAENLLIKTELFQQLERICSENTLLTSNTSSISITAIAAGLKNPSRLFGLHFFNPAPVMKLVEVVSGLLSDPVLLETGRQLCKFWGKIPVIASSTPGFIVNRVARSFYGEPMKMLQEGAATAVDFDTIMTASAGFRMGPFELMDLIGIDINYSVSQTVYQAMYNDPRFRPSLIQSEMVAAGTLGRKTGQGFYDYSKNAIKPVVSFVDKFQDCEKIHIPDDLGILADLFSGLAQLPIERVKSAVLKVNECEIYLSNGKTADELSGKNHAIALIDLSFDYLKAPVLNLTFSRNITADTQLKICGLFNALGKKIMICKDQPGMIAMRTIAMLINEAADAVFNGVCSENDVDLAMQYGVNYPKGLLSFAEPVGWQLIADVLMNLQSLFGDDRYRLSPFIKNKIVRVK